MVTATSRWAVVGLGQFARGRLLPSLGRTRWASLAGVHTRSAHVRQTVAAEYSVRSYETYDEVLADPHVQIVALVTPHHLHAEQTLRAAAAGKHVFVEKPMALTTSEARTMQQACETAGVALYVGFHLRFHKAHQQVREWIRSGRLGAIVQISATWAAYREPDVGWRQDPDLSGGALLTARGVHLLDLIRFVSGAEFATVSGESDGFRAAHPVDDMTAAFGRLTTGAIARMLCSRLVRGSDDTLEVCGTRGRLVCRGVLSSDPSASITLTDGTNEMVRMFPKTDMLAAELDQVAAAVAGGETGEPVAATGIDGARVTAVTAALVESIRRRQLVSLSDVV